MNGNDYFIGKEEKVITRKGNPKLLIIGVVLIIVAIGLFCILRELGDKLTGQTAVNCMYASLSVPPFPVLIGVVMCAISREEFEMKRTFLSDAEYDSLVDSLISKSASDPKEYLGLDESEVMEIEPIEFSGYLFHNADGYKQGKDGLFRSNLFEKATIFFTRNEVHMYKATANSISGKVNETTEVLFYNDIVSVSTDNEIEKLGSNSIEYLTFVLSSKGGNQFKVALLGTDNRQRSINAMRALIKEKKTQ